MTELELPVKLWELRDAFRTQGFDLRLVGGVVRDHVMGIPCKDVDLHTDATPEECVHIYDQAHVRWEPTGLQHGTTTVILDHVPYEITSLRLDTQTDGRHAQVTYTRDWQADLKRRDLTFNAMSMSLEGEILDPFGGMSDLRAGMVRFVGDPHERIQEDYLRILRWFRFRGRFETSGECDAQAEDAVSQLCHGLEHISRERVWMEMSKILTGPQNMLMMQHIYILNVNNYINLPDVSPFKMHSASKLDTRRVDAVTVLTGLYRWNCMRILKAWKTSKEDQQKSEWLNKHVGDNPFRLMAVDGARRDWACDLEQLNCVVLSMTPDPLRQAVLETWTPPTFPVTGYDLIALGIKPGPTYGDIMHMLKHVWADSDYQLTQADLLKMVKIP